MLKQDALTVPEETLALLVPLALVLSEPEYGVEGGVQSWEVGMVVVQVALGALKLGWVHPRLVLLMLLVMLVLMTVQIEPVLEVQIQVQYMH